MEFRLLGPVEVIEHGRPLVLGARQRALLAVLLVHANEVVSAERLIDAVWRGEPPATAPTALQVHVSRLRKLLGVQRIVTRAPGYQLLVGAGELDSARFERLLADARAEDALALWRGRPLAEFESEPWAASEAARLQELRLAAEEERIETLLGGGGSPVAELEVLVRAEPLRERRRGQLMRALYRAGRQADALAVFQQTRTTLIEELGIEPGRALQKLEQAILRQDPALEPTGHVAPAAGPAPAPGPAHTAAPGEPPSPPAEMREERKVVSVLFIQVAVMPGGGELADPEDVRAALRPFHAAAKREAGRFGGTAESFTGDAVIAVFGVPAAHEDDPERAVRAALAIRRWITEKGEGLQVRMAITTGVALVLLGTRPDEAGPVAAGHVVSTARRLQAAAPVNGIAVGERTYRATWKTIGYREAAPAGAKGEPEAIPAWEVVGARSRPGADLVREPKTLFIGRKRELDLLLSALARVAEERSPQLVTLAGVPGIGKTRLVLEFAKSLVRDREQITWRQGRSLPYGDGVSFWALGEIVKAQAGILDSDTTQVAGAKLEQMVAGVMPSTPESGWVARHLGALAGLGGRGGPASGDRSEAFAAWRSFLEALAEARPLVLIFEDLHWADDGLLDFVEYLAGWASGVPLLVICTARPELLDRRPGWGGGKPNALTLSLAPLSDEETARLIGSLSGHPLREAGQQAVLVARAGGNPLYAEQYVQMLADQEAGRVLSVSGLAVPESVQAIIGARLDLLALPEKRLLHDAAVIGMVFWPGAVAALGGGTSRGELAEYLHGLERKQFIRRERASSLAGESQYAFTHVLVREAAYGQLPRAERAGKHARAGGWLESLGRAEDHAEMLAHHYLSALELARAAGQDTAVLAPRARAALQAAGDRTLALNALAPAAGYYRAALALWPEDASTQQAGLLGLLGTVLFEVGELSEAEEVTAEGLQVAAAAGLPAVQARIRVLLAEIHAHQGRPVTEALAECEAATAVLESEADLVGLADAWFFVGKLRHWLGEPPAAQQALERALAYARQSGNRRAQTQARGWLAVTLGQLPIPADAALSRAEQLLQGASGDPWAEAQILKWSSLQHAYAGRFADARAAVARAWSVFAGSGAKLAWAGGAIPAGLMELIARDPAAAERYLNEGYEAFRAMGERAYLATLAGVLAEALYAQGRLDEAQQMTEEAQAAAAPDDVDAQARWRATRAKLLARRGQFSPARRLAGQAVALVSATSYAVLQAETLVAKAEVSRLAGARGEAATSLRAALRIYDDRHAKALSEQTRTAIASLTDQPTTEPA
jgi:predicted ATPase/DNA-binding SARP family transcriptional activator/class 3 adenylate cyclase